MAEAMVQDRLVRLGDLSGYRVAPGYPDIRGWKIYGADGKHLGEVGDLLVDPNARKARYLVADVGGGLFGLGKKRQVVIPIGRARLDDQDDRVCLDNVSEAEFGNFPDYAGGSFDRNQESRFMNAGEAPYTGPAYDEGRFLGTRAAQGKEYLTLHEEQIDVGTRQVNVGEAVVEKRVETERVQQDVPVMRENVTVERRPLAPDADVSGETAFKEDEVRIPLMAEEATVEKRVVPTEEVVVKKIREEVTAPVEAELRKERADVISAGNEQNLRRENADIGAAGVPKKEPV
jgi:uncharacterized protein (TIGR02271 family)